MFFTRAFWEYFFLYYVLFSYDKGLKMNTFPKIKSFSLTIFHKSTKILFPTSSSTT